MANVQDFSDPRFLPSNMLLRWHDSVLAVAFESREDDDWIDTAMRIVVFITAFIFYPVFGIATAIEKVIDFIAQNLQESPLHFSRPRSPEEIDPTNLLLTTPLEIQFKIFQHLEIHHLINLSRMNKDYCNTIFYHVLPVFINNNFNIPISQLGFNFSCTRELLRLRGNKLSQLCIRSFGQNSAQQLISECQNLTHLKLTVGNRFFDGPPLGRCYASPLARTVGELTCLTSLDLSHNRFGIADTTHILENLTNLTHLNLKGNDLQSILNKPPGFNSTKRRANSWRNEQNITEFAQKFGNLKKLQSLNLSENRGFKDTITPIIDAIKENENLNELSLCDTGIGIEESLQVLQSFPNLVHLDLSKNRITIDESQDLIEELLQRPDFSSFSLTLRRDGFESEEEEEQEILNGLIEQIMQKFPECNTQIEWEGSHRAL